MLIVCLHYRTRLAFIVKKDGFSKCFFDKVGLNAHAGLRYKPHKIKALYS